MTLLAAAGIVIGQLPVFAQTFLTYRCRDGSEFVVAFFERERLARLQLDGNAVALSRRAALSGSRYVKGDITLTITKTATTLKRGRRSTECAAM
jgi:membrane-bound inhibitor of C-type lysozyme